MDIKKQLDAMSVPYSCYGETYFDSLGLLNANTELKICSFLADKKYINSINSNVSVLLTTEQIANEIEWGGVCIVDNPKNVFFKLHNYLFESPQYRRPQFKTTIGEGSKIHKFANIAEKNVIIGNNVLIEEFVSIKENVVIGDNSIIRAGTIVGGEGFEQKRVGEEIISVHHAGGVIIGKNVELQQNNCVDKAIYPWDNTEIGDYCRTDNKVHIAHADKLEKRILIAACTCIAGRVNIGDDVWIGPGCTIINGITIGNKARVNIGSVVTRSIPDNGSVTGNFAINHEKFIENLKKLR